MAEPRAVLVTGARTGVGRGLAERYAAAGCQVVGWSRRPPEGDVSWSYERVDVTDERLVKEALAAIRRVHGRLDLVVHCAAVASQTPTLLSPVAEARRVLDTNLIGTFLVFREAAKIMMRQATGGQLVAFSSVHVHLATIGTSLYGASKAGVEQFVRVLAKELGRHHIGAHCVGLPFVRGSGMAERVAEGVVERIGHQLACGGWIDIEEVFACVEAIVRCPAPALSGQTVYLGGP